MRIGLNLLFLLPGVVGGTETYAVSLIEALGRVDERNEYYVFLNREAASIPLPDPARFHRICCRVRATRRFMRYCWEQLILPVQAKRYGLDLLHSLGYVQPLHLPCPSIVTIHDLNFHNPALRFSPVKRWVLKSFVTGSTRASDHVITVSEFSKSQLVKVLGIPRDKVTVTHNAVKKKTTAVLPFTDLQQRCGIRRPYVLGLSSFSPHKNMAALVEAFVLVKEEGFAELQLVLAGHPPRDQERLQALIHRLELQDDVLFTGYLSDQVLYSLYTHAKLFVFPSLYEGFGIPLLEAFVYETPVAASCAGSLPEIAADAALYFDPLNVEEMAGTIMRLLQDEGLRDALVAKGREKVREFTWEKSARQTLEVYNRIG